MSVDVLGKVPKGDMSDDEVKLDEDRPLELQCMLVSINSEELSCKIET